MIEFLYQQSNLNIFIIVALVTVAMAYLTMFVIKRFLTLRETYEDNTVISNISSITGIVYGVLAGLSALYLLDNISYTKQVVQREANAAANIYMDSRSLSSAAGKNIQLVLRDYLQIVIDDEWKLMREGKVIQNGNYAAIESMIQTVNQLVSKNKEDVIILREILKEIKSLFNAREERIQLSMNSLNIEIWVVILISTFLIIAINFFFKMDHGLHLIALIAEIIMTTSMIFLLIALDKPFQGEYVVEPIAFQALLDYMQKDIPH